MFEYSVGLIGGYALAKYLTPRLPRLEDQEIPPTPLDMVLNHTPVCILRQCTRYRVRWFDRGCLAGIVLQELRHHGIIKVECM